MKNVFLILGVLCVMLMFQGCATMGSGDINKVSYQVLQTSKATYDLVTDSINDLYRMRLITDSDYADIEKYSDRYMVAHNTAVDAVKAFKAGIISADEASGKVAAVTASLTALLRIAQPYILKLDREG